MEIRVARAARSGSDRQSCLLGTGEMSEAYKARTRASIALLR